MDDARLGEPLHQLGVDAADAGAGRALQARGVHAARHVVPLDRHDAGAHARRLQRRREPARSRADHDNIGLVGDRDGALRQDYRGGHGGREQAKMFLACVPTSGPGSGLSNAGWS